MDVKFADGSTGKYEDAPLAAGTEGAIHLSRDGKSVVKLYFADPQKETGRIQRIDMLIHELNPTSGNRDWAEYFTWPEKRVVAPDVGYRMRYASGLKTLEHFILGKAFHRLKPDERGWFIGRMGVAIKLATAANRLASMGLCYPDFSGKNILVDAFRARMALIDCDSLTVPDKLPPTVEGTSDSRAPEIVMRTVTTPSVTSDRHTLAVIFYRWLLWWHPLNGDKNFDPDPVQDDLLRYGQKALYIEHPSDDSNKAQGQVLKAHILGPELEGLFRQVFVNGLHHPEQRPQPYQWQRAFYRTYDHLIPCSSPYCDWRFFIVSHTPQAWGSRPLSLVCPRCAVTVAEPKTLPFLYLLPHKGTNNPDDYANMTAPDLHYVVGWPQRTLHLWHVKPSATRVYTDVGYVPDANPLASFSSDANEDQWYLHNLQLPQLQFLDTGGTWQPCSLKHAVPLLPETIIQFGPAPECFRARIFLERVI